MMVTVELSKPFSDAVGKRSLSVDFGGRTCGELLDRLACEFPRLKGELFTDSGEFTEYMMLFVNDKPVSALNGLDTELGDGDRLFLFFPVSGG
jgi:MoaD family protein